MTGSYGEPDEMFRRFTRLVSPHVAALDQVERWPARNAAALAALAAAEEGSIDLDEPAGPPGATIRHLLAHASGLPLDEGTPIAPPGQRRI